YITYPALCLFSGLTIIDYNYFYCFLSVIIHETAHLAAMVICKSPFCGVKISVFEIKIIEKSRHILDYKRDLIITSAGPLANILFFILFFSASVNFAVINLLIGAFNLLPAAGLDGGQMIYLLLSKHFSGRISAIILDIITVIISIPLFVLGILVLFRSAYNFSLLLVSMYLILSLFIKEDKYL
nr:hypothetical protein [Ruminococcus sp.]